MSTFTADYRISIVPKELTTLSDGSDIATTINSNIDKSLGGYAQGKNWGTDATRIKYDATHLTSIALVGLNSVIGLSPANRVIFLFIKILSAGSTGTPDVTLSYNDGVTTFKLARLQGVGDCFLLPIDPDQTQAYLASSFFVTSSGPTTVANIETLLVLGDVPV